MISTPLLQITMKHKNNSIWTWVNNKHCVWQWLGLLSKTGLTSDQVLHYFFFSSSDCFPTNNTSLHPFPNLVPLYTSIRSQTSSFLAPMCSRPVLSNLITRGDQSLTTFHTVWRLPPILQLTAPSPPKVQPLPPCSAPSAPPSSRSASLTTAERHWADCIGPLYPGMMT